MSTTTIDGQASEEIIALRHAAHRLLWMRDGRPQAIAGTVSIEATIAAMDAGLLRICAGYVVLTRQGFERLDEHDRPAPFEVTLQEARDFAYVEALNDADYLRTRTGRGLAQREDAIERASWLMRWADDPTDEPPPLVVEFLAEHHAEWRYGRLCEKRD